jgi:hypothetical protein
MYRIDNATATSTLPTPLPPGPVPRGFFQSGNPAVGQLATTVDRDWANTQQEEIANVVEAAGITLDKTNNAQLLAALQHLFVTRTKVTTNMTIYVSPTGNDTTGNGLTPGAAFATIQTAINVVYTNYDWNGHVCTIQLADGTYNFTGGASGFQAYFSGMPFGMPAFGLTLQGNLSLPQNVILNATAASCIMADRALMQVGGLTVTASGIVSTPTAVQGIGIGAQRGGWVQCSIVSAVNCAVAGFRADNGAAVVLSGVNLTLGGAGQFGCFVGLAGEIFTTGSTINVTGFSATQAVFASTQGLCATDATTFIGSATGVRYTALNCGVITTGGGGANYLPGSIVGNVGAGGVYT